jgi:hypothetical protein
MREENPMIDDPCKPSDEEDEGGDAPCWAHLFEEDAAALDEDDDEVAAGPPS